MPVEPLPCAPDGGGTPAACACAPSIATTPMCRDDGTSVLVVVRSECADCGDPAAAPAVVGWIDPATGTFTPGPAPADVGPCETPGCVETICVTRCDDTDGDGAADATFTELWCVRADGTTSLVLTYQGEPSTPYVPVAPVECTHACPDDETVMLCDLQPDGTAIPFLRRYTFLDGAASYEDVALDGQTPHVVTGTVGVCPTDTSCASPTTPVATVGLCLADGTPIAVLLTRDCDGVTAQPGWINLTTGQFSAGDPPPGARACGDARAFELTGVLCDTDPATGDVLGLVLVQYAYNPDGSLASVELLDPATGDPYVLQGELRICPGGDELPEQDLTVLCDVAPDGTATAFVRDYRRDATGTITGHTDYLLDGTAYNPAGTVGRCADPCCPVPICYETLTTPAACTNVTIIARPSPTIVSATVAANPQGWQVDQAQLDTTFNGNTTGAGGPAAPLGVVNCDNFQGDTGVAIDYVLAAPADEVTAVNLWNCFGGVVTDNDGIGSATLTLYDTGGNVLWTGPLNACRYATNAAGALPCVTDLGGPVNGVARMRLSNLAKMTPPGTIAPDIGWREINLAAVYRATLTAGCGTQEITAEITGTQAGLSYGSGQLSQSNGPHTLTFDLPPGVEGTIVTDNPGVFSQLDFTDGTAITVSGNQSVSFALELAGTSGIQRAGWATIDPATREPVIRDANTGEIVTGAAIVPCTGGGVAAQQHQHQVVLCDNLGPFLRTYITDASGAVVTTVDTSLDGADYEPTGTVQICPPDPVTVTPDTFHGELVLCDDLGPFVRKFVQANDGTVTAVVNLTLDGTAYAPTGTVRVCQPEPDCPAQTVLEVCKCSDDDGDGVPEVGYVELVAVDCTGTLTTLGTYLPDYSAPYTPTAPMDCDAGEDLGAPPAFGVQARRRELAPGQTWSADSYPTLQSVTAIAHGGDATVTTADGISTLRSTESATWSVTRDEDARLTGPLTITAGPGTVTITFSTGVKL